MIEVRVTDVFVRASKRLIKMYVSFKDDYLRLVADLESNTVHAIVKKYPCLPGNGWRVPFTIIRRKPLSGWNCLCYFVISNIAI